MTDHSPFLQRKSFFKILNLIRQKQNSGHIIIAALTQLGAMTH